MALKVKAKEKLQKIGKYANSYRYVMMMVSANVCYSKI